jgi:hypothetical protein
VLLATLAVLAPLACGAPPKPVGPTTAASSGAPSTSTSASSVASAAPSASTSASSSTSATAPVLTMDPIAEVPELIDVIALDGGLAIRTGLECGGGGMTGGGYRYAPIVAGLPDFAEETDEHWDPPITSTGAALSTRGAWPDLETHQAGAFRAGPGDLYETLGRDLRWTSTPRPTLAGWAVGAFRWSSARVLEVRVHDVTARKKDGSIDVREEIPTFRVISGAPAKAPSVPPAIAAQLRTADFHVDTFTALPSGEVIVAGRTAGGGIGTLLWTASPDAPSFFTTASAKSGETYPEIVGGDTLASVRLLLGDAVLRLEGQAWVAESKLDADGFPDVWFGKPLLRVSELKSNAEQRARVEAHGPWLKLRARVGGAARGDAIDAAGRIWGVCGDWLCASRKVDAPASPTAPVVFDAAQLQARRQASVAHGGALDARAQAPSCIEQRTCSAHYVLLDEAPASAADPGDYPAIRAKLKGRPELAKATLVLSVERGKRYLGARVASEADAETLAKAADQLLGKRPGRAMCAAPIAVRSFAVDPKTGGVVK